MNPSGDHRWGSGNSYAGLFPRRPPNLGSAPHTSQMRIPSLTATPWLGPARTEDSEYSDPTRFDYMSFLQQSPQSINYEDPDLPARTRMELALAREERREASRLARLAEPPAYEEMDGWRTEYRARASHVDPPQMPRDLDEPRRQADLRNRVDHYRERHHEETSSTRDFERAINYLEGLRTAPRDKRYKQLLHAQEAWVRENILKHNPTVIKEGESLPGPHPSSWLKAGTVFDGYQFTSHANNHGGNRKSDKWRVKVSVHAVDWAKKYIYGEMEADNVPDFNSESGKSSVITFLEGEIIDFDQHGLMTRDYGCTLTTDAMNWRRLKALAQSDHKVIDRDLARKICARSFLEDQLHEHFILMRWKGMFQMMPQYRSYFIFPLPTISSLFDVQLLLTILRLAEQRSTSSPNPPPDPPSTTDPRDPVSQSRASIMSVSLASRVRSRPSTMIPKARLISSWP